MRRAALAIRSVCGAFPRALALEAAPIILVGRFTTGGARGRTAPFDEEGLRAAQVTAIRNLEVSLADDIKVVIEVRKR